MKLLFFKTLWGNAKSVYEAAREAREAGFNGIEGPPPRTGQDAEAFSAALKDFQLLYSAEISATGFATPAPGATPDDHRRALHNCIELARPFGPVRYTAMAGSDLWSFDQSRRFLSDALDLANSLGVEICFETHRSRSLFHPLVAERMLHALPELQLTIDFSHWCVVCERLVMDELPHVLDLCAERFGHIHLRVGYDQGAQVPDLCAPRYENALEAHLRWWQTLYRAAKLRGDESLTLTPEFGPDGYQQIEASTNREYGNLWKMNQNIARRVQDGFASLSLDPGSVG